MGSLGFFLGVAVVIVIVVLGFVPVIVMFVVVVVVLGLVPMVIVPGFIPVIIVSMIIMAVVLVMRVPDFRFMQFATGGSRQIEQRGGVFEFCDRGLDRLAIGGAFGLVFEADDIVGRRREFDFEFVLFDCQVQGGNPVDVRGFL